MTLRHFRERFRARVLGLALPASALAGCGGDANLGADEAAPPPDEYWSSAADSEIDPNGLTTIYSGGRKVLDFTVREGKLYAFLSDRIRVEGEVELMSCSVDACESDRRTLWRKSAYSTDVDRLTASPSELFWVEPSTQTVFGCSKDDCESGPRTIARAVSPSRLAADSEFVYWVNAGNELIRCPHDGCDVGAPASPAPSAFTGIGQVTLTEDAIYAGYAGGRKIVRVDRESGTEELLYESSTPLAAFDVEAGALYLATNVLTGRVLRCPESGACGAGEVLADGQRWPQSVEAAGGALFWINAVPSKSELMKLERGAEHPTEIAVGAGTVESLLESDAYLYWSESDEQTDQIRRVAL